MVGYLVLRRNKPGRPPKIAPGGANNKDDEVEDLSQPLSPERSTQGTGATETTTPLISNTLGRDLDVDQTPPASDNRALHSKIEELDKVGKKYFKEKKVGSWMDLAHLGDPYMILT